MSTYRPEVGHRVRVIIEGQVTTGPDGVNPCFIVANSIVHPTAEGIVSIERLSDPEPEWQTGDVVIDAHGEAFISRAGMPGETFPWAGVLGGVTDRAVVRPLTLVARDGKPVTS